MKTIEHILFTTDFSECADHAFRNAIYLAKIYDAKLHILHVSILPISFPYLEYNYHEEAAINHLKKHTNELMAEAGEFWDESMIEYHVKSDLEAADCIIKTSDDLSADLIVIGTHGRSGFAHAMIGSVAEKIIRKSKCSVFTVNSHEDAKKLQDVTSICVPVDFSSYSKKAMRAACELNHRFQSKLNLIHVIPNLVQLHAEGSYINLLDNYPTMMDDSTKALVSFRSEHCNSSDGDDTVKVGDTGYEIADYMDESQSDLLVISTHGFSGLKRIFLGSVAERLIRLVRRPIFVVK